MLSIREFAVLVAITSVTTASTAQVVPGLGGEAMYTSDAGDIILDKLAEASELKNAGHDQAAAMQAVLTQMGVMASGGSLSASQSVMALFGESYEPVPPYLPEDEIYNRAVAPVAADGTVGPNLVSLEGGTAVLDTLVLGEVAVDTSILPANIQQYYFDLMGLGSNSQYIYAARFSDASSPGQFFNHFGFAYKVQLQGQDLLTFAPLGAAPLGPATLVDYVQVFANFTGMAIALQPTQQAAAPAPLYPTSPANPALDECLAGAAGVLDAAMQAASSDFTTETNKIYSEAGTIGFWAGVGALGVIGITAAAGLVSVYTTGGTATPYIVGLGGEAVTYLAFTGGLSAVALAQLAAAETKFGDDICDASNAAVDAGSACFEEHAPDLKDAFDADSAAALQGMGC